MALKNSKKMQDGCLCFIASLMLPLGSVSAQVTAGHNVAGFEAIAPTAPVAVSVNLLMPEVPSEPTSATAALTEPRPMWEEKVSRQFGTAADERALNGERGGTDNPAASLSSVVSSGSVGNNRAVDVVTGSNAIREGSFSNASGIPVVIQNTGANVLIQNSTIVNVQLR